MEKGDAVQIPVELILIVLSPIFFLCIALEWYLSEKQRQSIYAWRDSLCNLVLAAMHQLGDGIALVLLMPFFLYLNTLSPWHIETTLGAVAALFLLQDFCYYWFHRASHRVRWLWASHVAHHSSRLMNFSTAFRQSLTYPISGMWLFWTPLMLIGFDAQLVVAVVAINLAFQFFVHTRWGKHWGWFGYVFNTPAWHRVHHACNPKYIDKNFAGVLVIWDRLFGTFEPEDAAEPCIYGITDQFESTNPWTVTFYEWRRIARHVSIANSWRGKLRALFGPPQAKLDEKDLPR